MHASGSIWRLLETSGRHLGGIWEASTLGFPPQPKEPEIITHTSRHHSSYLSKISSLLSLAYLGALTQHRLLSLAYSIWTTRVTNLTYNIIDTLFMVYSKHYTNVAKEYEIIGTKQQKIHLGASILTCLWALEPVRGRLGDHTGMGTQKITKKSLFQTLLLGHICDRCWHFSGQVFYIFPRPLYFHLFAPSGAHMTQFRRLLATKLGTD